MPMLLSIQDCAVAKQSWCCCFLSDAALDPLPVNMNHISRHQHYATASVFDPMLLLLIQFCCWCCFWFNATVALAFWLTHLLLQSLMEASGSLSTWITSSDTGTCWCRSVFLQRRHLHLIQLCCCCCFWPSATVASVFLLTACCRHESHLQTPAPADVDQFFFCVHVCFWSNSSASTFDLMVLPL